MALCEKEIDVDEWEKVPYVRLYADVLKELGRVDEAERLYAKARAMEGEEDD